MKFPSTLPCSLCGPEAADQGLKECYLITGNKAYSLWLYSDTCQVIFPDIKQVSFESSSSPAEGNMPQEISYLHQPIELYSEEYYDLFNIHKSKT